MNTDAGSPSMDDVIAYVGKYVEGDTKQCANAMFYFLYKEILVNRMMILEKDGSGNRAALEHAERIIVDLNRLLMEQMKK